MCSGAYLVRHSENGLRVPRAGYRQVSLSNWLRPCPAAPTRSPESLLVLGYGRIVQVILPDISFGFSHLGYVVHGFVGAVGIMLPTAILGMMWGVAYLLRRRALLPCMAAHFLNDATALSWGMAKNVIGFCLLGIPVFRPFSLDAPALPLSILSGHAYYAAVGVASGASVSR